MSESEYRRTFADDVPEEERENLRELAPAFRGVRFDANDLLARAANTATTNNAGHVAQLLTDLENRGEIKRIPGTDPPEWELVS